MDALWLAGVGSKVWGKRQTLKIFDRGKNTQNDVDVR